MHPGIVVGMLRMIRLAGLKNGRVNFDGVNMTRARAQCRSYVIAGSRPNDGDVSRRARDAVGQLVIISDLADLWVGGSLNGKIGEVVNPLVIMAGRANIQQAILPVAQFEQLVRGIHAIPKRVYGPTEYQ